MSASSTVKRPFRNDAFEPAQRTTQQADEHTFGDLLANETHAASSQRRAHGHLPAVGVGPGNQQIRQV